MPDGGAYVTAGVPQPRPVPVQAPPIANMQVVGYQLGPFAVGKDSPLGGLFDFLAGRSQDYATGARVAINDPKLAGAVISGGALLPGSADRLRRDLLIDPNPTGNPFLGGGQLLGGLFGTGANALGAGIGTGLSTAGPGVGYGAANVAQGAAGGVAGAVDGAATLVGQGTNIPGIVSGANKGLTGLSLPNLLGPAGGASTHYGLIALGLGLLLIVMIVKGK